MSRMEFKCNYASQLSLVSARRNEAHKQLMCPTSAVAAKLLYIHFLTSMVSDEKSKLRRVHDGMVPAYKRYSNNQLNAGEASIRDGVGYALGSVMSTSVMYSATDDTCAVQLWWWAEEYDQATEEWIPIVLT